MKILRKVISITTDSDDLEKMKATACAGNSLEFELNSNGGVTVTITNELAQINKSPSGYCMSVRLDNSNRQQLIKLLTIEEDEDERYEYGVCLD